MQYKIVQTSIRSHSSSSRPLSRIMTSLPPISSLIRIEHPSPTSLSAKVLLPLPSPQFSTKWLSLSTFFYRYDHDPPDHPPRKWDVASRTTRTKSTAVDAVVIFARLDFGDGDPRILLVRQFRPPLAAVSVELPAGLIDEGESVTEAALRELKEETGFEGEVKGVHDAASLTPGMASETVCLAEVEVKGGTLGQHLESGENIEVISVPIKRLEEALRYMVEHDGNIVMHAVSLLAVGLRLGAQFSHT